MGIHPLKTLELGDGGTAISYDWPTDEGPREVDVDGGNYSADPLGAKVERGSGLIPY